eukprot:TRINITY_DN12923_c0_g1_i1.p1 TRINITY_DN12923_c0_g1~~TRINITY_DN12923_c0_g1_i1.p1  ORF type:complete len:130 (-),score=30.35 TRINITY_DN12923_c0_g1_i1:40-429(-)
MCIRDSSYLIALSLRHACPNQRICVVCTDPNPQVVTSRMALPLVRPLVKQGWLDFAVLRAGTPSLLPLQLLSSGATLTASSLDRPLILLANYVFDSLLCDAVWVSVSKDVTQLLAVSYTHLTLPTNYYE